MSDRFAKTEDMHAYLERIPMFGRVGASAAHFSLDHIEEFCKRMGNPEKEFRSIHVAGTNGKGTTCQMLASIYMEAGCQVGLYTSPHLIRIHERFRVNDKTISDEELLVFFRRFEADLEEVPLTYFELSTAIAYWFMNRKKVDLAIVETGLGGRLDATNVIHPEVSVITSISLDHTELLGETIGEIAKEKAGIIKRGCPVVTGVLPEEAHAVIRMMAETNGSALFETDTSGLEIQSTYFRLTEDGKSVTIQRYGRKKIDIINIAVCRRVVQILQQDFPVGEMAFIAGIESCDRHFPEHAHFQKLHESFEWYFDGAHNREAMETLIDEVFALHPGRSSHTLIFSMMRDKAEPGLLKSLNVFSKIWYVDLGLERNASCNEIKALLPAAECYHYDEGRLIENLQKLKTELVIFTGSFYFYSQVKKWMASLTPSED